ncbi:hypothetical protein [uncultured Microbacterium sp.]|nr:hypothetical protein [uncultured Microbacterium sp.]
MKSVDGKPRRNQTPERRVRGRFDVRVRINLEVAAIVGLAAAIAVPLLR